jgi:hypothetical protein
VNHERQNMSVRDAVRIANVLTDESLLRRVLYPSFPGEHTVEAAQSVGKAWKDMCVEMHLWKTVREFVADEEEDDSEIHVAEAPEALRGQEWDVDFPWIPFYVGYSKRPSGRWVKHQSSILPYFIDNNRTER